MKCHGCVFFELCARLPAFKIERIASSERGSLVNWRTARLVRISSETVIGEYLPVECRQESKRKSLPPETSDHPIISRDRRSTCRHLTADSLQAWDTIEGDVPLRRGKQVRFDDIKPPITLIAQLTNLAQDP